MSDRGRSAFQCGIERLYHYERFDPEYLTATLRENKIHFSDPSALNDPWDCRPWFDEEALDADAIEALIAWIVSFTPVAPLSDAQLQEAKNAIRTDPVHRRAALERFSENFLKVIPNRWKIYCLTPVPDSTLMWSHYADNHRGICLEFGTDVRLFASAFEVTYRSDYPKWAPHLVANNGAEVLLTKSDDWKYEREFRIIGLGGDVQRSFDASPLTLNGTFMHLPRGAIKAVIIGCEANYAQIEQIVKRASPGLTIKRAVRSPNKYRLVVRDCSNNQSATI
jgi:Protein of unknown function (DUF2971)